MKPIKTRAENTRELSYFVDLWNSTSKKAEIARYGWTANPWAWVR